MGLKQEVSSGITKAMKAGDKLRLSTLRLLLSAITYKEKETRSELTDDDILKLCSTLAKQRRDSIEQFRRGGREELAQKEEQELEILLAFLPEQLSPVDIEKIVKQTAAEVEATTMKDMGRLMKAVMGKVSGKADGKLVQQSVKAVLS